MAQAAAQKGRRTQAERSAHTRRLLLDAALECLEEKGYAGTTTTLVADRAGVSRGAQLHHYPTRAALVAAAIEHLFSGLTEEYGRVFASLSPARDRLGVAIDLLWSMFTKPSFAAVLELYVAARTDPELHARLLPVADRHRGNVARLAVEYFPAAAAANPEFETVLMLILDTMHGMAVSRIVYGADAPTDALLGKLRELAAALFAESAAG